MQVYAMIYVVGFAH